LLKKAKLRQEASLEDIDYGASRGLSQQVILELADPGWVAAHRNVLISGPTGVDKSFLACALGNSAARAGYTVLYLRAPRLFETLQQSRGDGSHLKTLSRLSRLQLLIIDDFLLTSLADSERLELLEVIEDRYELGATIIASQCPLKDWHPNIGDPTLADAICNRLLHNAYKIEMRGDSMRVRTPSANRKNDKIEATQDPNFFTFYSPDLEGFTGVGNSIEDCLYKAKRCTTRGFTAKPIAKADLDRILSAGRLAPTACNKQPQRIIVVQRPENILKVQKAYQTFGSQCILIVCRDTRDALIRPFDAKCSGDLDIGILCDHILLAARELNIGSVMVGLFDPFIIKREFDLSIY